MRICRNETNENNSEVVAMTMLSISRTFFTKESYEETRDERSYLLPFVCDMLSALELFDFKKDDTLFH